MLRLACSAVRRSCTRSFATDMSPVAGDKLSQILNPDEDHKPPSTKSEPLDDPPRGPAGSLPAGGNPQPGASSGKHALPMDRIHHLHVFASRNNTILTYTDHIGNPRSCVSSGLCGFKNVQRSGYEAGYQCAVKMFQNIAQHVEESASTIKIELLFKGFGAGREALYRALMTTEGETIRKMISRMTDTTPLKIGGTRAKKARRL